MKDTANRIIYAHEAPEPQTRPIAPIIDADAEQAEAVEQEVF